MSIISSIMAFAVLVAFTPINDTDGFYQIDPATSSIEWSGSKITGKSHTGTVSLMEGGIQLTDGKIINGKFAIDMTTLASTDLEGGMAEKLIGHLNSDDFFSVEKHKVATIAIISMNADGLVKANLTIKGITNEVSFPVTITVENGTLTAVAEIEVDRTKFDVRYGSDNFFDNLGNKAIDNVIKFNVTLSGRHS